MHEFDHYVFETISASIQSWEYELIKDVYVVSLYFWNEDDDLRRPCVSLSYNTVRRWRECTPAPGQEICWPIASDSDEAKWNYAFWLHDMGITIGASCGSLVEQRGLELRKSWIGGLGLWYFDEDEEQNFQRILELGERIGDAFVGILKRTAMRLHSDGVIEDIFAKPIPIVVHELEYSNAIIPWTREANPVGLADEYIGWVKSLGSMESFR